MMISNRWQKRQTVVQHATLAALCAGVFYALELSIAPWLELLLIIGTVVGSLAAGRYLNRRFADTLIRVLKLEVDVTARLVQRALNSSYLPFSRQTGAEAVRFDIRGRGLTLVVEPYPLNLPVDDHIIPSMASKITLRGVRPDNARLGDDLCRAIDDAFSHGIR